MQDTTIQKNPTTADLEALCVQLVEFHREQVTEANRLLRDLREEREDLASIYRRVRARARAFLSPSKLPSKLPNKLPSTSLDDSLNQDTKQEEQPNKSPEEQSFMPGKDLHLQVTQSVSGRRLGSFTAAVNEKQIGPLPIWKGKGDGTCYPGNGDGRYGMALHQLTTEEKDRLGPSIAARLGLSYEPKTPKQTYQRQTYQQEEELPSYFGG